MAEPWAVKPAFPYIPDAWKSQLATQIRRTPRLAASATKLSITPARNADRASRLISDHKAQSSTVIAPYCTSVVVETLLNCIDFNRRKIVLRLYAFSYVHLLVRWRCVVRKEAAVTGGLLAASLQMGTKLSADCRSQSQCQPAR